MKREIQRDIEPFLGVWALPGGFVRERETLEEAARRELREETGIESVYLEQLYTFGDPGRDPRGRTVTVAYYALIPQSPVRASTDAAEAAWFPAARAPRLAFDHAKILDAGLRRLRAKIGYTTVGFELLPATFTLTVTTATLTRIDVSWADFRAGRELGADAVSASRRGERAGVGRGRAVAAAPGGRVSPVPGREGDVSPSSYSHQRQLQLPSPESVKVPNPGAGMNSHRYERAYSVSRNTPCVSLFRTSLCSASVAKLCRSAPPQSMTSLAPLTSSLHAASTAARDEAQAASMV